MVSESLRLIKFFTVYASFVARSFIKGVCDLGVILLKFRSTLNASFYVMLVFSLNFGVVNGDPGVLV
jgi:hypothetical protein